LFFFLFFLIYSDIYLGQPVPDKNTHMFNLNVNYKNQIPNQSSEVLDLYSLERKVENLTNMPDSELSASIFL